MSVVSAIAHQKRIEENARRDQAVSACVCMLADFYLKALDAKLSLNDKDRILWNVILAYPLQNWPPDEDETTRTIDAIVRCWKTESWSDDLTLSVFRRAANAVFGDPMALSKSQLQLRQHATQFYNPLSVPINVHPMGLPDEHGQTIVQVVPGGLVKIPYGYLVGGKRSTLAQCCPQLRPLPKVESENNLLDLTPSSYHEWMTYYSCTPSNCCERMIQWSDTLQTLICSKCLAGVEWHND